MNRRDFLRLVSGSALSSSLFVDKNTPVSAVNCELIKIGPARTTRWSSKNPNCSNLSKEGWFKFDGMITKAGQQRLRRWPSLRLSK